MKIVILGNMGYVGPGIVDRLRKLYPSATLVGYDAGFFASCLTNVGYFPEAKLDQQYFGDVRDFPDFVLQDTDVVINLAAISNDPMGMYFEQVTMDVNYSACINIAKRAKAMGVRSFVFASSCSIYGAASTGKAKTETSNVNPLTPYAKSKVLSERDLRPLASESFTVTCLRFGTACGMSPRLRLDLVLNDFVASALTTRNINILSDGTPWRPLIHVRDMALAFEWAISRSSSPGDFLAVNVGCEEWNFQVKDLARAVAKVIPGVEVSINIAAPADKRSYLVDFGMYKILAPLHQPQNDLLATIQELKDGLEGMNFNDPDFRDSRFVRLKVLTDLQKNDTLTQDLSWNFDKQLTLVGK